ncbi:MULTISPECIES: hypothetical protein [unclassified Curtobacterium]|uniref:hypothetical protein n=1 Tax=unclassified Curtobacterium TaxID=257496 RepID=UPI0008DC72B0|nr:MULTISPECIES: hypothetical protein [unclassified Curtobacterium]OIH92924.1 hypothetical protein BIU92_08480 [Curtobacterium sp. MCBA15_003]OII29837.1 hypothetical protein BIU94_09220 [Curtobacterium sp. MMLR14_006]
MRAARTVLVVVGVLVMGFGGYVLVTSVSPQRIGGLATWLLGAVILHDAILSPFVVVAGLLLRRAGRSLRAWVLVVVQAAIVAGSVLALVVLPEIAAQRHGQKNPTVLPFDYGTRLLLVEGALLLVVVAVLVVGVVRARRGTVARTSG